MTKKLPSKPIRYSKALAKRILNHISAGGTLAPLCKGTGYPASGTVHKWRYNKSYMVAPTNKDDGEMTFGEAFSIAEDIRLSKKLDEMMHQMSEDGYTMLKEKLGRDPNQLEVRSDEARRRREIDTLKFMAAREIAFKAKRVKVEHSGEVSAGLQVNIMNYAEEAQTGNIIDLQPDDLKITLGDDDD